MIDKHLIRPGFTFTGKVNGARLRIVKVENGMVHIKEIKTGKVFVHNIPFVEHLLIED